VRSYQDLPVTWEVEHPLMSRMFFQEGDRIGLVGMTPEEIRVNLNPQTATRPESKAAPAMEYM
jgi:hypothetical protein